MNLLERAASFLAAKASKIALAALPLAALTAVSLPANASIIPAVSSSGVTFSTGGCSVSSGTGTCSEAVAGAQGGNTRANWIALYSNTISSVFLATKPNDGAATAEIADSSASSIALTGNGTAFGSLGPAQSLPVSWNFIINNSANGGGSVSWNLSYTLGSTAGNLTASASGVDSSSGPVTIAGNSSIAVPASTGISSFQFSLSLLDLNGDNFTLQIPQGSTLDLNPTPTAAPEPSTLILAAGAGLAGLLLRRRK